MLAKDAWIEVSVYVSAPDEKSLRRVKDFFLARGFSKAELVCFERRRSLRVAVYLRSWGRVRKMEKAFSLLGEKAWRFRKRYLARPDWLDKWQRSYPVTPLGRRFAAVPLWKSRSFRGSRIPVFLDPQGAFGSGMHETTRLVVRLMEPYAGRFKDFLDIGTGTGILAVIAARLGARRVHGIDAHGDSVKSARANLKRNGVRGAGICRGNILRRSFRPCELVSANLLSGTLVDAKEKILASVVCRGHLIVSGIALTHLDAFRRDFRSPVLRCVKILRGRSWAAVCYKKGQGSGKCVSHL